MMYHLWIMMNTMPRYSSPLLIKLSQGNAMLIINNEATLIISINSLLINYQKEVACKLKIVYVSISMSLYHYISFALIMKSVNSN